MIFPVEQAELCRAAVPRDGAEHGEPFGHIAAVVFIGVDKERRRLAVRCKLKRGLLPEKFHIGPRISALVV